MAKTKNIAPSARVCKKKQTKKRTLSTQGRKMEGKAPNGSKSTKNRPKDGTGRAGETSPGERATRFLLMITNATERSTEGTKPTSGLKRSPPKAQIGQKNASEQPKTPQKETAAPLRGKFVYIFFHFAQIKRFLQDKNKKTYHNTVNI